MTTYNIPVESAEKQAVRANSKGGSSAISNVGSFLLKPPASVVVTPSTSGGSVAANTYYYYVTRVSNGVESFSAPVVSFTTTGSTSSASFVVTDQTTNAINPVAATSYNLYVGTTVAGATKQVTSGTTTLVWAAYSTSSTKYVDSPAMVAYPWSSGSGTPISSTSNTLGTGAYMAPTWVDDVIVHNPNQTTGYSGFNITGEAKQVRQIRTNIIESQIYSRTDTATVKYAAIAASSISTNGTTWTVTNTHNFAAGDVITISGVTPTSYNGTYTINTISTTASFTITNSTQPGPVTIAGSAACGVVSDALITWSDFGKPVTGTGIPTNAYVGNVTPGASFILSSVQGQNVPYYPGTTTAFNATAAGTAITVTGSNLGAIPVQTGQYRTTRWQG